MTNEEHVAKGLEHMDMGMSHLSIALNEIAKAVELVGNDNRIANLGESAYLYCQAATIILPILEASGLYNAPKVSAEIIKTYDPELWEEMLEQARRLRRHHEEG